MKIFIAFYRFTDRGRRPDQTYHARSIGQKDLFADVQVPCSVR